MERYSREKKSRVLVGEPYMISQYNKNMGGVDLLDNAVANYRINIRGKKWYVPIFLWMLDVAMVNACGCKMDQLSFGREVVQTLLMKFGQPPSRPGPSSSSGSRKMPHPARQGPGHYITPTTHRRRCLLCKNKTIKKCLKCGPLQYTTNVLWNLINK